MAAVEKFMNSASWNFSMLCAHVRAIVQWRPHLPENALICGINFSKNLWFSKKFNIVPLVLHSVETLRRRADFKWEKMCASVLRLKGWKPHPFIGNGLGWANFFSKGGSVDQNFHFFTKMAGEFLFINSGSCPSPVLCAHVSRLKRCKPFPYRSIRTDAICRWPKGGRRKKIRIFCHVFKYRPDRVVWLGIELGVAVVCCSSQLSRGWYKLQPPKRIVKQFRYFALCRCLGKCS